MVRRREIKKCTWQQENFEIFFPITPFLYVTLMICFFKKSKEVYKLTYIRLLRLFLDKGVFFSQSFPVKLRSRARLPKHNAWIHLYVDFQVSPPVVFSKDGRSLAMLQAFMFNHTSISLSICAVFSIALE